MGKVIVNDKPWQALLLRASQMRSMHANVGVLASKGGSAKHAGGDITMVELAAVHEFGSPAAQVPERSFIRSTFFVRRAKALTEKVQQLTRAIVVGGLDVARAINLLGAWGAGEVKNTITEIDIPPPLAPRTVDAKGSEKPLVDTGQLLQSISWEAIK